MDKGEISAKKHSLPVYLDNNATTKPDKTVLQEMIPYLKDNYYNPSSNYREAQEVSNVITKAREQVANLLGSEYVREIIFTSGGTESANLAIRGALRQNSKKHIITTKVEHHCVLNTFRDLEKQGYKTTYLNVDSEGDLDLEEFKKSIRPETALISIMWANNETGVIFPVEKIAEITKKINPETLVYVDAVQAAGKIPLNLKDTKIDMLSVSGHKIHAPKGTGALYIRRGVNLSPTLTGGHQESGLRAGTENVPGIIGLGKAAELAQDNLKEKNQKIKRLRDKLEAGILKNCYNAKVNGKNRLSNTTNISFQHLESELILMGLEQCGILASSSSACLTGNLEPSYVLSSMGLDFTQANGAIRFGLSKYTTEQEINYVIEKTSGVINRLVLNSPYQDELNRLKKGNAA